MKKITIWLAISSFFLTFFFNTIPTTQAAWDMSHFLTGGHSSDLPKFISSDNKIIHIGFDMPNDDRVNLVFNKSTNSNINNAKVYVRNGVTQFSEFGVLEGNDVFEFDYNLNDYGDGTNRNLVGCLIVKSDKIFGAGVYNPSEYKQGFGWPIVPAGILLTNSFESINAITGAYTTESSNGRTDKIKNSAGWQGIFFIATHSDPYLSISLAATTKTALCNRLFSNWEKLKDDIRGTDTENGLLNPSPGSEGKSKNVNWDVVSGNNSATILSSTSDVFKSFGRWIVSFSPSVEYETVISAVELKKLILNKKGQDKLYDALSLSKIIDEDAKILKASSYDLSDCSGKLKKMKNLKSLEDNSNSYNSIEEFLSDVQSLLDFAKANIANLEKPVTTDGTVGKCGPMSAGNIFNWALCNIAVAIENLATKIITSGMNRFNSIVGVIGGTPPAPETDVETPAEET